MVASSTTFRIHVFIRSVRCVRYVRCVYGRLPNNAAAIRPRRLIPAILTCPPLYTIIYIYIYNGIYIIYYIPAILTCPPTTRRDKVISDYEHFSFLQKIEKHNKCGQRKIWQWLGFRQVVCWQPSQIVANTHDQLYFLPKQFCERQTTQRRKKDGKMLQTGMVSYSSSIISYFQCIPHLFHSRPNCKINMKLFSSPHICINI